MPRCNHVEDRVPGSLEIHREGEVVATFEDVEDLFIFSPDCDPDGCSVDVVVDFDHEALVEWHDALAEVETEPDINWDSESVWAKVFLPDEHVSTCPACAQPIDFCPGHGEIGDPDGAATLRRHDEGDHVTCDPEGCDEWREWMIAHLNEHNRRDASGHIVHAATSLGLRDWNDSLLEAHHHDEHESFQSDLDHDHDETTEEVL